MPEISRFFGIVIYMNWREPARVKVFVAYFMRPMAAYPVQLNVR